MCLGIPAEVVAIPDPDVPRAMVAIGGVERLVATDLLVGDGLPLGDVMEAESGLKVGDWVLVHVGFALSRIDAAEAAITLEQIKSLGGGTFEGELKSFTTSAIE